VADAAAERASPAGGVSLETAPQSMPKLSGLLAVLVVLFAWSPRASAQETSLRLPTIVFIASAASDQASTVYGFHTPPLVRGASTLTFEEADPLYAWTSRHSGPYVAASTAVDLMTILVARRLGRQHPRLAVVGLYTLSALRFTAAVQNLHRAASLR
jgi:hypothetical protein